MKLSEWIDDLELSDDLDQLRDKLAKLAQDSGFIGFNFLDIGDPRTDLPFYFGSVPQSWEDTYKNNQFVAVDPYISKARRTNLPFNWGALIPPQYKGQRKPGAVRLYEAVQDYGYHEGFVVPFHFRDALGRACSALVVFIWANAAQEFEFIMSERRHDIHLKVIYWAQRVLDILSARRTGRNTLSPVVQPREGPLTDRERTILSWAARGKTVGETADIVGISINTVETYFKNIYVKMHVTNKTHAVVKAIYSNLIDV